jgi:diguanylate cyclase (GGDEF)-like protein
MLIAATWMVQVETRLGVRDRRQASLDPLTGVFNRRYLEDVLARELPRTRRRQHPLSLLILDLDGFKRYNDTYGHLAGDRLLAEVASSLAGAMRAGDVIARYGGDEFVIVLPHTPGETARRVAKELMSVIPSSVTLSVGVGCVGSGIDTVEQLVAAADSALRRAKSAGTGIVAG